MRERKALGAAMVMLALSASGAAAAATPEQKCQGGKNELAGKFASCLAKAEKKLALTGDTTAYGNAILKCETKYASGWTKQEDKAVSAGGTCVDVVAENDLRDFVAACMDVVSDVAEGGALPVDVVTCNDDLAACSTDLGTAQADLMVCEGDLAVAEQCGNGAIDAGEDCDLGTLNAATCGTEGFAGGVLSCTNGCAFDTGGCYNARFVDNADGTITDNDTGLMWEKKVKLDFGTDFADRQDADNYYMWSGYCSISGTPCQFDAATAAACVAGVQGNSDGCAECGMGAGTCTANYPETVTVWQWLGALNAANFGGHNDWRVPTKSELLTLIDDTDVSPPAVDVAFDGASCGTMCTDVTSAACSCTQSNFYWSASTYAPDTGRALVVEFADSRVRGNGKLSNLFLRAVRGGS